MHEPTPHVAALAGEAPPAVLFGPPCPLSIQTTAPPPPIRTTRAATATRTITIGRTPRAGPAGTWNAPGWPANGGGSPGYGAGCGDHEPDWGGDPDPGCRGGGDHGDVG